MALSVMIEMADLGDISEPITKDKLTSKDDQMVKAIIYLYSLEPPFYGFLNWASRA